MEIHVTFHSSSFPPAEGEDAELINAGTYGKRLVEWLRAGLTRHGFAPGEAVVEDWGWLLPLPAENVRAFVGCSTPFDPACAEQECHCTLSVTAPLTKRLFGRDPAPAWLARLRAAVEALIAEHPDIRNPEWSQR